MKIEIDDKEQDVIASALKMLVGSTDKPIDKMIARNLLERVHYGKSNLRYFRFQRATLAESIAECVRVNNLEDIIAKSAARDMENFSRHIMLNYRIDKKSFNDSARLSSLWSDTHYVLADMKIGECEYQTVVVGMCNFFE